MTEKRKRPSSALLCTSACKTSFSEELCERDSGSGREQGVRQGKQEQGEITFAAEEYEADERMMMKQEVEWQQLLMREGEAAYRFKTIISTLPGKGCRCPRHRKGSRRA